MDKTPSPIGVGTGDDGCLAFSGGARETVWGHDGANWDAPPDQGYRRLRWHGAVNRAVAVVAASAALAGVAPAFGADDPLWQRVGQYWQRIESVELDYQAARCLPGGALRHEQGHFVWRTDDSGVLVRSAMQITVGPGLSLERTRWEGWLDGTHWWLNEEPQLNGMHRLRGGQRNDPRGRWYGYAASSPRAFHCTFHPAVSWHKVLREREEYVLTLLGEEGPGWLRLHLEPVAGLWETELVMDPGRGYLPIRASHRLKGRPHLYTYEVTDAQEVQPGLWYPTTVVCTDLAPFDFDSPPGPADGSPEPATVGQWETVWLYSDIRLNHGIPDAALEAAFPPGTEVDDQIAGARFVVADPSTGLPPPAPAGAGVDPLDESQSRALATHLDLTARMTKGFTLPADSTSTAFLGSDDVGHSERRVVVWGLTGAVTAGAPLGLLGLLRRRRKEASV